MDCINIICKYIDKIYIAFYTDQNSRCIFLTVILQSYDVCNILSIYMSESACRHFMYNYI